MRLYWYWPFLRSEDIEVAEAVADSRVEHLLVHTLDRAGVPTTTSNDRAKNGRLELRADLPEVDPSRVGTPRWWRNRSTVYLARRRLRAAEMRGAHDINHIWFINRFTDAIDIPRLAAEGRLVVNVHDVRPHNERLPGFVNDRLLGRIYRSDAQLIVHHDELAHRLMHTFGIPSDRIHIVPHAVRTTAVAPPSHGSRVLFFGTFRQNKGLEVLLDAVRAADPAIDWEIIGRGEPALEDLVTAAAERFPSLTATVGHADEAAKAAAFARADLVVLPYTSFASQSGVLHDAYAHAKPVVVTDVGALGPTVSDDETGIVIDPADSEALVAAVTHLLDDDQRRTRMSANATIVAADRSPARTADRLHAIYKSLL